MLNIEALKTRVAQKMPASRFSHTLGVYETALTLAKRFDVSEKQAALAALLHDVAKYESLDEMQRLLTTHDLAAYCEYSPLVWHAPVGAIIARNEFDVTDEDVLNAIKYHTTGRKEMSELEKVIFLADFIEPNRTQPGVDEIRLLCETSLDEAMAQTLENTVNYLNSLPNSSLHPDTLAALSHYKTKN